MHCLHSDLLYKCMAKDNLDALLFVQLLAQKTSSWFVQIQIKIGVEILLSGEPA